MTRSGELFPVFILLFVAMFFSPVCSYAFDVEISPKEIMPGDPFIVKVSGSSSAPDVIFEGRSLALSGCGKDCYVCIGALDVNADPVGNHKVQISNSSKSMDLELIVKPAAFPEIHLTLSQDRVVLSPENLKRSQEEKQKLDAIFMQIGSRIWTDVFTYPVSTEVSSPFGVKRLINKKMNSIHRGIDMRAKAGDPVKAANTGRVVLAEELFFGGNTVVIDHGLGVFTFYMHLSEFSVSNGDLVAKGQAIGLAGSTGRSSGPHLHFGIKVQSISVNPVSFLRLGI
ncbi:MAG: M23 family metallopeptidase [Nitrospiraceae bacterium]|nr:M23 family metallopeptidase [Nitrospiraceae bacterium]